MLWSRWASNMFLKLFIFLSIALTFFVICQSRKFSSARALHTAAELSDYELSRIAGMSNEKHFISVLDKILVPRVVGTKQHDDVADFIAVSMENMGWSVERQKFSDQTPNFGVLQFQNIVARLNPNADRQLVMACHYDSKYMREGSFLGATDSAVPCAMLINLAYVMKNELETAKLNNDLSLTFIFFDGEEAFQSWSATDSLYGARKLATHWEQTQFTSRSTPDDNINELDRIDLFVLLDLLGAKHPTFYNYFDDTTKWYSVLYDSEERLAEMGKLKNHNSKYFHPYHFGVNIEDDHLPFLRKGVPILHIIPTPFPNVWHKMTDNRSAVDFKTVENLNKIFRVFVARYLNMKI